jgi:hypothetical protein
MRLASKTLPPLRDNAADKLAERVAAKPANKSAEAQAIVEAKKSDEVAKENDERRSRGRRDGGGPNRRWFDRRHIEMVIRQALL